MLKLDVGGGKATLFQGDEEQKSWDVPAVPYKVGFHLGKSGRAQLKRIRLTYDRQPPPKQQPPTCGSTAPT